MNLGNMRLGCVLLELGKEWESEYNQNALHEILKN